VVTVLFTALSRAGPAVDEAWAIARRGYLTVFAFVLPPLVILAAFPGPILQLWLGSAFHPGQEAIVRYVCLGVLANGLSHIPVAAMQGIGSPKAVSYIHLCELVPSAILFFWLISRSGAVGAAQAWAIRSAVDLFLMHVTLRARLRQIRTGWVPVRQGA
jgi:O-antigen/teichoic acid export membrane protein